MRCLQSMYELGGDAGDREKSLIGWEELMNTLGHPSTLVRKSDVDPRARLHKSCPLQR